MPNVAFNIGITNFIIIALVFLIKMTMTVTMTKDQQLRPRFSFCFSLSPSHQISQKLLFCIRSEAQYILTSKMNYLKS